MFKVMERPFLRDVTFYLVAGFWAFYIFWKQVTIRVKAFVVCLSVRVSFIDLFHNFMAITLSKKLTEYPFLPNMLTLEPCETYLNFKPK